MNFGHEFLKHRWQVTKTLPVLLNSYFTNEFVNLLMNMHVMWGLPEKCTTSDFEIKYNTQLRLGLGTVLVLLCSILTTNRLSYVVNT